MRRKNLKATQPTKKTAKKGPSLPKKTKKPAKKPVSQADFLELQKFWYDKLQNAGFKDLEFFDHKHKDPGPLIKGQSLATLGSRFNVETLQHYRRVSNWLNFNKPNKRDRLLLSLYSEGQTYRQISAKLKRQKIKGAHLAEVYKSIQKLLVEVLQWNVENIEGLDFVPRLKLIK